MSAISNYLHFPIHLPSWPQVASPEILEKIKTVGQKVIVQLGVSLAVNVAFCAVFGSYLMPPSMTVLTVALGAVLTATLVALTVTTIWNKSHGKLPDCWDKWGGHLARTSLVNTLTLKLNRYVHELGHAGAALMTYVKANPKISVNFRHGSTTYTISNGLTRFGRFLGEHRALVFTTAAGLAAPVLCAITEFAIAYQIYDKHPHVSSLLTAHGMSQLLDVVLYTSVLAFNTSKEVLIHDSMMLWKVGGIHPLVTFASVIALPIAEMCLFYYLQQKKKRLNPAVAAQRQQQ